MVPSCPKITLPYQYCTLIGTLVLKTNNRVHTVVHCLFFVQWFSSVPTGDALRFLGCKEKQPEWRNGRWQNYIWGRSLFQGHQDGFLGTAAWLAGFHINTSTAPFHLGPLQSNWGEMIIWIYCYKISKDVWLAFCSKRNAVVIWPRLVMHVTVDCMTVHNAFHSGHVSLSYNWRNRAFQVEKSAMT